MQKYNYSAANILQNQIKSEPPASNLIRYPTYLTRLICQILIRDPTPWWNLHTRVSSAGLSTNHVHTKYHQGPGSPTKSDCVDSSKNMFDASACIRMIDSSSWIWSEYLIINTNWEKVDLYKPIHLKYDQANRGCIHKRNCAASDNIKIKHREQSNSGHDYLHLCRPPTCTLRTHFLKE